MKKLPIKIVLMTSVFMFCAVQARDVRTPLPYMQGKMRYPVEYHWENEPDENCWNFNVDTFGAAYYRSSDKAYSTCHGRSTVPFANLLFGKSEFRFEEAFAGSDVPVGTLQNNPWLAVSTLKTNYDYQEQGAIFGATVSSSFEYCDVNYRYGLRARLPFRDTRVGDVCGISDLVGEQLDDVFQERQESIGTGLTRKTNTVYAARLDFLSTLLRVNPNVGLVNYAFLNNPDLVTIADQLISAALDDNQPIVAVIKRDNGSVPVDQVWGNYAVTAIPTVQADGSGLANNDRGRLLFGTDYFGGGLATNSAAQGKLWVVPTIQVDNVGGEQNELTQGAGAIQSAIRLATADLAHSVQDFIKQAGLNFCDGRNKGLGDLDLELFIGRNWGCNADWWTDFLFGARFPTSDDDCDLRDCKKLLVQPLGNGNHFEVRIGAAGGYDYCDWVKFMGDLSFSWALKHTEQVAAPFKGAKVKNIAPCVPAEINWWYTVGHLDVNFFAYDCCGFNIGYELYHKDCDKISLCAKTATDFAGRINQELDVSLLKVATNQTAHKIRVGFFSMLGNCEISTGWSHVVAGKNVPRDTDWYASMSISF